MCWSFYFWLKGGVYWVGLGWVKSCVGWGRLRSVWVGLGRLRVVWFVTFRGGGEES